MSDGILYHHHLCDGGDCGFGAVSTAGLLRKLLHVIVLEAMLIAFGFYTGILHNPVEASLFGLTVLVVYIAVNLISWLFDKKEASEINRTLKSLQTRHQDDPMGLG